MSNGCVVSGLLVGVGAVEAVIGEKAMKILLVGDYRPLQSQSMYRFSELMRAGLAEAGHEVRLLRCPSILGKFEKGGKEVRKWLGYIDQYALFPPALRRKSSWADVVHCCDTPHAIYVSWLGNVPHVVTCHDVLAIRSALGEIVEHSTRWSGRVYQRWILSGLRRSQHVACVSAETRAQLVRVAKVPRERTSVVPNAINYPYSAMEPRQARACLRGLGAKKDWLFFLHVGGDQWYKNRAGAVRIFQSLCAQSPFGGHHLIMVGKPWTSDLRSLVEKSGLEGSVHEWTAVTNEELRALYSLAEGLIFPSLQEGFGWPVVEAQACGCPVFTSDRSPMTEVGANGAVYFDPDDPRGAAEIISKHLEGRAELVRKGLRNVLRFSRDEMIFGYEAAYQRVIADQLPRTVSSCGEVER